MKTAKTILALALAMIAFLPACKKVDYTKNSSNILISHYKTIEEFIGMERYLVDSNLRSAGWVQLTDASFQKLIDGYKITYSYEHNSKDKVCGVSYMVEQGNGNEAFSNTDYSDFLVMLGETPKFANTTFNFSYAWYWGESEGVDSGDFENYKDYQKNLSKVVEAYNSDIWWENSEETGISIGRYKVDGYFYCSISLGE